MLGQLRLVVQLQLQPAPAQRMPQRQADQAQHLRTHRLILKGLQAQRQALKAVAHLARH